MIGVKEMCAMLLAGGMGAGGVVAVQQAKPVIAKKRPAVERPVQRTAARPEARQAALNDCPSQIAVLSRPMAMPSVPDGEVAPNLFVSQTPMGGSGVGIVPVPTPGGGGGIGGGGGEVQPPPPAPSVPEPASWAMIISGFGLIGFALRRRPLERDSAQESDQAGGAA